MLKTTEREALREIQLAREPDIRIAHALLRPASRILEVNGEARSLEPRIAQLLVALARQGGGVLGREQLTDLCWGGRIVGEDAINRCVAKARKVSTGAGFAIETVPRVGYKLVVGQRKHSGFDRRRALIAVVAAGAVFGIAFLLWSRADRAPPRAGYPTIAVGDFVAATGDGSLRARALEIGPQVVDALVKTGIPTVTEGGSAAPPPRYLIRGRVSSRVDAVHALIQMDDARTRMMVVSQEIELDSDEIPRIADKVAAAAADAVTRSGAYYALASKSGDPAEIAAFMDVALQVAAGNYLEAELQAKRMLEQRPTSTLAPFALTLAATYALPLHPLDERVNALKQARSAASLARKRLPAFGDVYLSLCTLYPVDRAACEASTRKGLAIDSSAPTLRSHLALVLMDGGYLGKARPMVGKALAETPYNPSKVLHSLYLYHLLGLKPEETYVSGYAERYWPKLRFAHQRFSSLMAAGRWRDAEALLPLVRRVAPGTAEPLGTIFQALHSRSVENIEQVRAACDTEPEAGVPVACFTALSMLGRPTDALKVASRFYPPVEAGTPAEREALFVRNITAPRPLFMIWGDGAKAMRQEPGFAAFAEERGLLRYWKRNGPPDMCKRDPAPVCKLI